MYKSAEIEIQSAFDNHEEITVGLLVKYMLEVFPNSSFLKSYMDTANAKKKFDEDHIIEAAYKVFRYEVLRWCGCGLCAQSNLTLLHILKSIKDYSDPDDIYKGCLQLYFGVDDILEDELLPLVAYQLDYAGLIDHASNIRFSYLTTKGQVCKWLLEKLHEKGGLDV